MRPALRLSSALAVIWHPAPRFMGISPPSPDLSVGCRRQIPITVTADDCFCLNGFSAKWALFRLASTNLPQPPPLLGIAISLRSSGTRTSRLNGRYAGRHKTDDQQRDRPEKKSRCKPTAATTCLMQPSKLSTINTKSRNTATPPAAPARNRR